MNSNKFIHPWAGGLTSLLSAALRAVFGPDMEHLVGPFTWTDLGAAVCWLTLALLADRMLVFLFRKRAAAPRSSRESGSGNQKWAEALCQPLHLLIWLYGLYMAAMPLLAKAPKQGEWASVRLFVDRWCGLGLFGVLLWILSRFTRSFEKRLSAWASNTDSKLDDLAIPLLGRSLRVIIPVVGVIFALPLIGLPQAYAAVLAKGSSIAIIGTVAWILFQVVHLGEKAVLARYDITAADNLQARKVYTQVHVLSKTLYVVISIFTVASILMLFEEVRRFGTSLLASAGVVGIIVGFAAQRTIANLFAGFQLAMTQPIRLDDVVIVEGEWGRVEEITLTYVVVSIWDERRLIVPLSYFIEKPFQNWTRVSASLLGSVFLWMDYSLPLEEVRRATQQIVEGNPLWDKRFWNLQVTDANERALQIRVLATAADSAKAWDLRCQIREHLIAFVQRHHPEGLPRVRVNLSQLNRTGLQPMNSELLTAEATEHAHG